MTQFELGLPLVAIKPVALAPGVTLLRAFALADETDILDAISCVTGLAEFRNMSTPGGFRMSVAMSNCGEWGWITDEAGYRYSKTDPLTDLPWPDMPLAFRALARSAAERGGFPDFEPDACLVNRYEPGARMTLHQDRNEVDFDAPIVSVSLGLSATFQLGGMERSDKVEKIGLAHGDVLVWGGPARLRFHGVLPLKAGHHDRVGPYRINLTFRRAR
jgi:alkylated DNA repair protein (DNA oxidative demethylase)